MATIPGPVIIIFTAGPVGIISAAGAVRVMSALVNIIDGHTHAML